MITKFLFHEIFQSYFHTHSRVEKREILSHLTEKKFRESNSLVFLSKNRKKVAFTKFLSKIP